MKADTVQATISPAVLPVMRTAIRAGLFAIAYYIGGRIGLALTSPIFPLSILWPPNAIILTALLLTPPRTWWVYLLATIPAHIAIQLPAAVPVWRIIWQLLSNPIGVCIAAYGLRRFTTSPLQFDRLRQLLVFLGFTVIVAPCVAAFVSPAFVLAFLNATFDLGLPGGTNYLQQWSQVVLSNALAYVTIVPTFVLWITNGAAWLRSAPPRRYAEACLLGAALLVVTTIAFGIWSGGAHTAPALLYAPLPILLWAALRFGPVGASSSLLVFALLSTLHALSGYGPFITESPAANVVTLQVFLLTITLPMLVVATLMKERSLAETALREREQETRRQLAQLSAIYHQAPVGLSFVDTDLRYVSINERLAQLNGLPAASHLGRPLREVLPEWSSAVEQYYQEVLATGRPVSDVELHGSTVAQPAVARDWLVGYDPVKDDQGAILGVSTMVQDITERKQAYRLLEQRVAERTRELSQRTADLERAEAEARQSRDELATQLVVSQQITATLELEPLLHRILEQLERIERFDGAAIFTLEGDALIVRAFRSATITGQLQGEEVDLTRANTLRTLIAMRQPLIADDRALDADELSYLEPAIGDTRVLRSWMGIPLLVKDQVIGVLILFHHELGSYGPQAQARVQLFANQAALAIENAQLYQAAQEAAVLEERHRLARDLHDAVTQSLFSASLIAEGLRDNRSLSPAKLRQGLEDLRQLTRGALAEMRALLYELHPGGLAEKPLGQLLDALCTAFTSRTQIPVALTVTGPDRLQPQVQEMLYRIAQEALNNISKHAAASAARVALTCGEEEVVLIIADDGRGFELTDRTAASVGMGMGSMRERAAKIGAVLRIESQPGSGTTVTVVWREAAVPRAAAL